MARSTASEAVRALAEPLAADVEAEIYDVTYAGGKLAVMLTRTDGIDLDALATVSRRLSEILDETEPISGSYTLEVTSPGLERPLRTPAHFAGALGETVTIRTHTVEDGARRVRGELTSAGDESCTLVIDEADGANRIGDVVEVTYAHVDKARTIFTWGSDSKKPSPNQKSPNQKSQKQKSQKQK